MCKLNNPFCFYTTWSNINTTSHCTIVHAQTLKHGNIQCYNRERKKFQGRKWNVFAQGVIKNWGLAASCSACDAESENRLNSFRSLPVFLRAVRSDPHLRNCKWDTGLESGFHRWKGKDSFFFRKQWVLFLEKPVSRCRGWFWLYQFFLKITIRKLKRCLNRVWYIFISFNGG